MPIDSGQEVQGEETCGWADVNGSSCGLERDHRGLHVFSIEPPEEFFEEEVV